MNLPPLIELFFLTIAVAYLMVYAGLGKRALERKRVQRVCPSCGRRTRDCGCRG
jgi:hypothetical protein